MNTTVITCYGCNGRKQVSPLGGILKNCAICNGIGYLEEKLDITPIVIPEPSNIVEEIQQKIASIKPKRKYVKKK